MSVGNQSEFNTSEKILEVSTDWKPVLTPSQESNKYSRGVVSIVLSEIFPGAALFAAQAARAVGAGYVQVFCPSELYHFCQIVYPGIVFRKYDTMDSLVLMLRECNKGCLVFGSGWGAKNFDIRPLLSSQSSIVFDGGLLTNSLLGQLNNKTCQNIILTPHEGELERLVDNQEVHEKRKKINCVAQKFNGTLVAKGYETIISNRDCGSVLTDHNSPFLATAGSGDVLSGMIAGLVAQGLSGFKASCCAVYLHREIALNQTYGLTAEKLIDGIPEAVMRLP